MQLESSTLPDDIVRLRLSGRLDVAGVQAINDQFAFATTTRKAKIIVDLSEVSFLASIGIRMLLASAQSSDKTRRNIALRCTAADCSQGDRSSRHRPNRRTGRRFRVGACNPCEGGRAGKVIVASGMIKTAE